MIPFVYLSVVTSAQGSVMGSQIIQPSVGGEHAQESVGYWQLLSAAVEQMGTHPHAVEPRFAQIEALIGLGLGTLASQACEPIEKVAQIQARLDGYKAQIAGLSDDCFLVQEREGNLRANLDRIKDQLAVDESRIEHWLAQAGGVCWYRAMDGNIVRCNEQSRRVAHLSDVRSFHSQALVGLIEQMEMKYLPPILIEGVDPPWILKGLLDAKPPKNVPNFEQRLMVFQKDWDEFFDGLSCVDFGDELASQRVLWFVGEGASDRLLGWFEDRCDDAPPTMVIQNPLLRQKGDPDCPAMMRKIDAKWSAQSKSRVQWVRSRRVRSREELARKFERILGGGSTGINEADRLRVLIPTSRYTSYVRYVAADLADALTRRGCRCHIKMEQDNSQIFSKGNYLGSLEEFDPDMVVSINYPRVLLNKHSPADIPHVCWIQDAMGHLFDTKVGHSIGEMDFVVGMIKPELSRDFGYPEKQLSWMPMVASGSKFSGEPTQDDFDCEIAWVTHQSGHPDLLKEQILETMREQAPNAVEKFGEVLEAVERLVTGTPCSLVFKGIDEIVDEAFFPSGVTPEISKLRWGMLNTHVIPYAERVYRHQVALWAGQIADRRGWRMKLYGNGWEKHPQLSRFASGPLGHDEALAKCYRNAGVHLHASINQVMHQRVGECLLSGGLPVCRSTRDSFSTIIRLTLAQAMKKGLCEEYVDEQRGYSGLRVRIESSEHARLLIEETTRLGHYIESDFDGEFLSWPGLSIESAGEYLKDHAEMTNVQMFARSTDLFFTSEQGLESLIERAIEDRDWRSERIRDGAGAMPKEMTIDGFAGRLLELVHNGLYRE